MHSIFLIFPRQIHISYKQLEKQDTVFQQNFNSLADFNDLSLITTKMSDFSYFLNKEKYSPLFKFFEIWHLCFRRNTVFTLECESQIIFVDE